MSCSRLLLPLLLALLLPPGARAVPLLWWNLGTDSGAATSYASAGNASGVQSASLTRGAGFPGTAVYIGSTDGYMNYHNGNNPSSLAAAVSANHYIQCVVAPASGQTLSLSSLDLYTYTQDTTGQFAVHYSLNGFASAGVSVGTGSNPSGWNGSLSTLNLSGVAALQNVAGPVTFRIYFYGPYANGYVDRGLGGVSGSAHDLTIHGSTQSGPSTTTGGATTSGATTGGSSTGGASTGGSSGGLPSPWQSQDIGSVGNPGSATHLSGVFTLEGSGSDIWDTADGFRFVHQTLSGDGEIRALVGSLENTDSWAKGGVMIRDTLTAGSKHAFMALTAANGAAFQRRTATGGASDHTGGGAAAAPVWVRLVRSGATVMGYRSNDGASWTQVGSANVSMNTSVYVGLAVTAHNNSTLCTATFSGVSVQTGSSSTTSGASTGGATTGSGTTGSGTTATGTGLAASYFNNVSLQGTPVLTRTDAQVDFSWGSGSPGAGVSVDNFSVRWSGQVEPTTSGNHSFQTESDDGIRLYVNGALLIDNWTDHGPTVDTSSAISLTAGQRYNVLLEYYERGGGAVARLRWITPGSSTAVAIPQARLFPGSSGPSSLVCNKVRFYPRAGFAGRMLNGRFTGSNSGETTDFVELVRITSTPAEGQWTELTFSNNQVYRWLKYEAPAGAWGNVAEVEFYNGNDKLIGVGFGTAGSNNNSGNTFSKALDLDLASYYDAANADGAYVGINLGASSQTAAPSFSPAPGNYTSAQTITLTSATSGSSIRYTTDGSTPSATSGTLYTAPFTITGNTTVAAVSYKSGLANSAVTLGSYTIGSGPPPSGPRVTYHLGNSLTDTINGNLAPIAQSAGYTHTYMRWTIPGAGIEVLRTSEGSGFGTPSYANDPDNVFNQHTLTDFFVQPFPNPPGLDLDANGAKGWIDRLYVGSPNCQVWIYGQWPVRASNNNWTDDAHCVGAGWMSPPWFPTRHPNPTNFEQALLNKFEYYETLRARMDNENGGKSVRIVPGGLALAEIKRKMELGQVPGLSNFVNDLWSDDIHLNSRGAYLIGLTHFACIYGVSPVGIVTSAGSDLTAQQATIFQQTAWDVVRTYPWSGVTGN